MPTCRPIWRSIVGTRGHVELQHDAMRSYSQPIQPFGPRFGLYFDPFRIPAPLIVPLGSATSVLSLTAFVRRRVV